MGAVRPYRTSQLIAEALAVIHAPGVLREVRSAPPLTIRQVVSERDGTCALCLVGSAAGPLPGDDLTLRLELDAGASATLVAAGATIAQGTGPGARLRIEVELAENACLDADPGALIVCADARVDVELMITLAATASLRWHETVVLGRSGEPGGASALDWDVRRAGRPLLRQRIDLTDPELVRWPGLLGQSRTLISELLVGPSVDATTVVHGRAHVTQKLAPNATLTTRLAR
jgi:urease accessory protein